MIGAARECVPPSSQRARQPCVRAQSLEIIALRRRVGEALRVGVRVGGAGKAQLFFNVAANIHMRPNMLTVIGDRPAAKIIMLSARMFLEGKFGVEAWTKSPVEFIRGTAWVLRATLGADRNAFMEGIADKLGRSISEGNNKEGWAVLHALRRLGGGRGKKNRALNNALPLSIDAKGHVLATRHDIARDVAKHFSELECAERISQQIYVQENGSDMPNTNYDKIDPANVITPRETELILSRLDTGKAAGPDRIFNEVLRCAPQEMARRCLLYTSDAADDTPC
eukprot:7262939-Pyramimonas_sp.AAC.1